MIIYYSMFALLFFVCVYHQRFTSDGIETRKSVPLYEVIILFAYIIFWIGIRNAFIDTATYIRMFNSTQLSDLLQLDFSLGSGWGFIVIEALFKTFISSNYHVWLMFIAIISGICVASTFWRYSEKFFYTVYVFLATTTFSWMMNGIRQFLVVSILFACFPLITNKKFWKFLIVVLVCSTIHGTALLMIPAYFVAQGKPWRLKSLLLIAGMLMVVLFTSVFIKYANIVLESTSYSNAFSSYLDDDGVNPLRVLVFSITPVLAFLGKARLEEVDDETNCMINLSLFTACLFAIGMVTNGIMIGRLPIYTLMYEFILLPSVIDRCFAEKSRKVIYVTGFIGFATYFLLMSRGFYYSSDFTGMIS